MSFIPQSLVFVRIAPKEICNIYDSRLTTHTSNLAFSSQLNSRSNGGFYTTTDFATYSLSGEHFDELFFARRILTDISDNPLFAIKESNARNVIFANTTAAAHANYDGSPAITGPVVTFRGDSSDGVRGVNFMDMVVFALECDLDTKASLWDANSYANVVSILQPIRDMSSLLNSSSAVICSSLNRLQIARELAKAYDSFHSINAAHADSAQKAVYAKTNPKACWDALLLKLDGTTARKVGYLAISVLFRNTTPRAKDYEFKIHIKISSHEDSQTASTFFTQHAGGFTNNVNVQISGFSGFY